MTETLKNMNVFRKKVDNSFLRKISMPDLANLTEASDQTDVSKESFKMPEPNSAGLPMAICKKYIEMVKNGANISESQKPVSQSTKLKTSSPTNKSKKDIAQFPTSTPMKIPVKRNTMLMSPVMSPISKDVTQNKKKTKDRRSLRNAETNTTPLINEENVQNKENKEGTEKPKIKVLADHKFAMPIKIKHLTVKNSVDSKSENNPSKTSANIATEILDEWNDDEPEQVNDIKSGSRTEKIIRLTDVIKGKKGNQSTKSLTTKAGKKDMRSENGRKKSQTNDTENKKKSTTFPKPYNPPNPPILDNSNLEESKSKYQETKDEISKHQQSPKGKVSITEGRMYNTRLHDASKPSNTKTGNIQSEAETIISNVHFEKNTHDLMNNEEKSNSRSYATRNNSKNRNKLENKNKSKENDLNKNDVISVGNKTFNNMHESSEKSFHESILKDIPDTHKTKDNISRPNVLQKQKDTNCNPKTPKSSKKEKKSLSENKIHKNQNSLQDNLNLTKGKTKNNKTVRDLSEIFEAMSKSKPKQSLVDEVPNSDNICTQTRSRSKENYSLKIQEKIQLDNFHESCNDGAKTRSRSKDTNYSLRNQDKIELDSPVESDNIGAKSQIRPKDKIDININKECDKRKVEPQDVANPALPKKRGRKKKVVTEENMEANPIINGIPSDKEIELQKQNINEIKHVGRPKKNQEKQSPKKRGRKKKVLDIPVPLMEKELERISPKKITKAVRQGKKQISPVKVKRLTGGSTFSYMQFRKLFPEATKSNDIETSNTGRPKRTQRPRKADVVIILNPIEMRESKDKKKHKKYFAPEKKALKKQVEPEQVDSDRNTDSGIFDNQNEPSTSLIIQTKPSQTLKDKVFDSATNSEEVGAPSIENPGEIVTDLTEFVNKPVNEVDNIEVNSLNKKDNEDIVIETNGEVRDIVDMLESSNAYATGSDTPASQSRNSGNNNNEIPSNEQGILLNRIFSRKRKNVSFANSFTSKRLMDPESTDTVNTIYFPTENGNAEFITWFVEEPQDSNFDYIPGSHNTISMAKTLKVKNKSWGIIKILPGGNKSGSILKSISMSYIILEGKAEVSVHNRTKEANKLDRFFIPKGAEYSIRNMCSKEMLLMEYCKFIE